jgi:hypothetical protein
MAIDRAPVFSPAPYPANLKVDYPNRNLNRLSSFFRLIWVIPIMIVLVFLIGSAGDSSSKKEAWVIGGIGFTFIPLVLMILFRQKYPRWWFDWNLALAKFCYRVSAYVALLRDEYPSTDEEQSVHIDLAYPDVKTQLMRGMPLVKWFLAVPHIFVLIFLAVAVVFCVILAWFAILFTGRYPKGLFEFVVGVMRWGFRVEAYAILLVTDKYPPFSLE